MSAETITSFTIQDINGEDVEIATDTMKSLVKEYVDGFMIGYSKGFSDSYLKTIKIAIGATVAAIVVSSVSIEIARYHIGKRKLKDATVI